jgi:NitT/TauT family transport system permease protein
MPVDREVDAERPAGAPPDDAYRRELETVLVGSSALESGPAADVRQRLRPLLTSVGSKLLAVAIAVGAWQLVVWSHWKPEYVLPPPRKVFPELWRLIEDGTIATAMRITFQRAATGYLLALAIGVAVGVAVSASKVLRAGVGSFITGLQTMPSVAWFPFAILLFKITEGAIMFVVVLGAAPSIANGLIAGVDSVPPLLRRAGKVLGARRLSAWRHVTLPAALPTFLGGLKQGWAFSWRSLMAGELIVIIPGKASLGALLQTNRDLNDMVGLLAVMLVILFVGIVVDAVLFGTAERWVRRRWGLADA